MRKTLLSFSLLLFTAIAAFAQAPQLFNYQGVARTAGGSPLANQTISLRLTIHDISAAGAVLYQESHTVTTNPFGLYVVSVGNGTNTTGTFSSITWGTNDKYMQVEVDPAGGSSFATLGATQLLSVPYAVYSNTAGTAINALNFTGTVSMAGDVTGTNAATTVVKLQGRNLSAVAPTNGEVLTWNSITNDWEPSLAGSGTGTVTSITAGPGLTASTNPITTTGTIDLPFVGTSGTYGSATQVPVFNTDAYGRITSVTNTTITSSSASGTTNYISKFTAPTALGNSAMYNTPAGQVGLGTTTPIATFDAESATDTMAGNFNISNPTPPGNGVLNAEYTGTGTATPSIAIVGTAIPDITVSAGVGVGGIGGSLGLSGVAESTDPSVLTSAPTAVQGQSFGNGLASVGVAGFANGALGGAEDNYGVYGQTDGSGTVNDFAGEFNGNLDASGDITCGGTKFFRMDDPLDPANKFLYHSCVESDEMTNLYSGNVVTDASGSATVMLPAYFEALNKDFRYQLTVIGTFAQAIIGDKIKDNKFVIKTNQPNVEVSWQVTGVRHDAYANAHPMKTEVEKPALIKGMYIHPDLFGKSMDLQIGRLNPKPLKNMKQFSSAVKKQDTKQNAADAK